MGLLSPWVTWPSVLYGSLFVDGLWKGGQNQPKSKTTATLRTMKENHFRQVTTTYPITMGERRRKSSHGILIHGEKAQSGTLLQASIYPGGFCQMLWASDLMLFFCGCLSFPLWTVHLFLFNEELQTVLPILNHEMTKTVISYRTDFFKQGATVLSETLSIWDFSWLPQ